MKNEWADAFANCVIRRPSYDEIMSVPVIIFVMIIAPIASIATFISIIFRSIYTDEQYAPDGLLIGIIMIMCISFSIISFTMFSMAKRSKMHDKRDKIWRESLIKYVESHGGDCSELWNMHNKSSEKYATFFTYLSFAFWFITISVAVIIAYSSLGTDKLLQIFTEKMFFTVYISILMQFILTIGMVVWYPFKHNKLQVEFTKELSKQLKEHCDINIEPMQSSLKKYSTKLNILLFIVTLGIYALIIIGISCHNMNKHIYSQWSYEDDLLKAIMAREGATGVIAIHTENENPFIGFIKSQM